MLEILGDILGICAAAGGKYGNIGHAILEVKYSR